MTETTLEKQPECSVTRNSRTRRGRTYRPIVDIVERSDALIVLVEMPGVRAEDVDIQFEKGMLTIHGAAAPRQDENTSYMMREYGVGDFDRTFQLSDVIDASKITAETRNGVLTLHLPKVEQVRPRKIEVKVS